MRASTDNSAKSALYNDSAQEYDPNSQVVPWTVKLPGRSSIPLVTGARSAWSSAADYKPFKDCLVPVSRWTLCVHDQSPWTRTFIDPDYSSSQTQLDQLQRCWFHKILQDIMQASLQLTSSVIFSRILIPLWKEISCLTMNSIKGSSTFSIVEADS
jgi:hypothetical protein